MRSKIFILCVTGVLLLFGLNGLAKSQQLDLTATFQEDTLDIGISYATAYPGSETWLEFRMKNPMPVMGYDLLLMMSNPDVARFCHDDTGGCVIADGGIFDGCECFGDPCLSVHIWWVGEAPIPPSPNYVTLFRICAKTCCIPDSTTERCAFIYLQGELSDEGGSLLPFRYYPGELCVWWSVPGDASGDSLVTMADLVFLVNYLYRGGPEPCVCEAADCNPDSVIDLGDLVYLINYLFVGGPPPYPGTVACPHEDCWPE